MKILIRAEEEEYHDYRGFLESVFQMQKLTDCLKVYGTQCEDLEECRERLEELDEEAKEAFEMAEAEITCGFLHELIKKRGLSTVGGKRVLVARLLRDANYFEEPVVMDAAGVRKKRKKWTEEETDALLEGYAKYGHGKWERIKSHSPEELKGRNGVQIKDKARTLYNRGELKLVCKRIKLSYMECTGQYF